MALSPTPLTQGTANTNALNDFNTAIALLNAAFPIVAANLGTDSVETLKIKAANVTLAKIANIATARLLGRNSANAGVIEELEVSTVKTMLGNLLKSKVIAFTRDCHASGESIAYTGVGFKPSCLLISYHINGTAISGDAFIDSTLTNNYGKSCRAGPAWWETGTIYAYSGGATQIGTVDSLDNDGFTISWTEATGFVGTLSIHILCLA